jgi:hypothetical protein
MIGGAVVGLFGGFGFVVYYFGLGAFDYLKLTIGALCFEPEAASDESVYDESES